jgi:topoisomerase-4 subunit A
MKTKKTEEKTIVEKIYDYTLEDIMGDRFGRYSKSIIQDRALPDVRDGLKPVQRRILWTMWENHNTYDKPYRKCGKIVGDVMGKYHPHGDSSIYGAMIYMSQNWKVRERFVDVHGNNGSIDGDGPAAYRYTECRLTRLAEVMLKDINRNSVEMTLNYSDEDLEPTVLPANYPNLLVNGSTGISSGYATNIPPHNLGEIIDAAVHRIDNPNCRLESILNIVKGPDFPTGGIIEGRDGLISAYTTGKGKVVVKAKCEIVKEKGRHQIIIHEIPFDVLKEQLRKKIEDIKIDKKVDGILDVYDISDREHMGKMLIELKKEANSELILNYLLKNTDLQVNYNFNMVAIVNRRPMTVGILAILDAFLAHQKEVILRRTKFDLEHAQKRLHIVEGLLKAVSILDEVIKTIRESKNKADSIVNLVKKFDFTEEQATAIVMMRLYTLSNTDIEALLAEQNDLNKMIEFLNQILNDENILKKQMKKELLEVKKNFATPRLTEIRDEITEIKLDMKSMIPKENVVVVVTNEGYVKRVPNKSYTAATEETGLKPGDYITGLYNMTTLDNILVFTNLGNYLFIPVHKIIEAKWKDLGKHVNNYVTLANGESVVASTPFIKGSYLTLVTKNGMIKNTLIDDFEVSRSSKTMTAMKLKDDDEVINVLITKKNILVVSTNGYYTLFDSSEVPISSTKASGVKAINLKDDTVAAFATYDDAEYINVVTKQKTSKRVKVSDFSITGRAKRGDSLIKKVKSNSYEILNCFDSNSKDILCIKCDGDIREVKNTEIPIMDLSSTGSNISKYQLDTVYKKSELVKVKEPVQTENTTDKDQISFINEFKL